MKFTYVAYRNLLSLLGKRGYAVHLVGSVADRLLQRILQEGTESLNRIRFLDYEFGLHFDETSYVPALVPDELV